MQLAGRLGLGRLTVVVVDNRSSTYHWPDGVGARFALEGWSAARVDGRDHDALERALAATGDAAQRGRGGGAAMTTMRKRFYERATEALHDDPRAAIVLAEIGASELPARHERLFNVGIREQLMIGVAAGLAFEGLRPIAHSYAPFLVERPYEQIKLDLGHQDVGADPRQHRRVVRRRPSGRTHQAPADVALLSALPGWTIQVPGHPDELERMLAEALGGDDRVYIRMSEEANREPVHGDGLQVLRRGSTRRRSSWRSVRRWTRRWRRRSAST